MARFNLNVNGVARVVDVEPDTPVLYVLRDDLALKGPKFGCGLAQCGSCTIHVNGEAVRSCVLPVEQVKEARSRRSRGSAPARSCRSSSRPSSTSRPCSAATASTA